MKSFTIITNNNKIYDNFIKFNHFGSIEIPDGVNKQSLSRIIGSINKKDCNIDVIKVNNKLILKKRKNIFFNVYKRRY